MLTDNYKSADLITKPKYDTKQKILAREKNYGKSNVLNSERPREESDGQLHHALTTRHEKRWQSTVFAEPIITTIHAGNRKRQIYQKTGGKAAIYGDAPEPQEY